MTKFITNLRAPILVISMVVVWAVCVLTIYQPFHPSTWYREPALKAFQFCAILCLILGGRMIWSKPPKLFWVVVAIAAISAPFVLFAHAFGQFNLFSLLFHLEFGTEGASLAGLGDSVAVAVLSCGFFVLAALWFQTLVQPPRLFLIAMIAVLAIVSPISRFAFSYLTMTFPEDAVSSRLMTPETTPPAVRPDVIIVYLEGLERGFLRSDLFGDVNAPILEVEQNSVSLTNVDQVAGTDWSIAGIAASLCGVPLVPNGLRFRNNFAEQKNFLSNIRCLPDVLADADYKPSFMVGSVKSFGGQGHFLESHSFETVLDLDAQRAFASASDFDAASTGWTIDDQMVLHNAQAEYLRQAKGADPIAMVIETYGPHGITSILSRECTDDGQSVIVSDVVAAVECTNRSLARFLDFVDENRGDRPTAVILMSDHLNHHPMMKNTLPPGERRNLILLYPLGFESPISNLPEDINKQASMLDVYPTILDWLGFVPVNGRAGLGVSLFSDQPTLLEEFGLEKLNAQLIPNPALAKAIWE